MVVVMPTYYATCTSTIHLRWNGQAKFIFSATWFIRSTNEDGTSQLNLIFHIASQSIRLVGLLDELRAWLVKFTSNRIVRLDSIASIHHIGDGRRRARELRCKPMKLTCPSRSEHWQQCNCGVLFFVSQIPLTLSWCLDQDQEHAPNNPDLWRQDWKFHQSGIGIQSLVSTPWQSTTSAKCNI